VQYVGAAIAVIAATMMVITAKMVSIATTAKGRLVEPAQAPSNLRHVAASVLPGLSAAC